jgi:hypothetical protein
MGLTALEILTKMMLEILKDPRIEALRIDKEDGEIFLLSAYFNSSRYYFRQKYYGPQLGDIKVTPEFLGQEFLQKLSKFEREMAKNER